MVSKPKRVLNKMSWNYRVINYGNSFYIGEVYYNKNGKPHSFTDAVVCAVYDEEANKEEFEKELKHFNEAAEKPMLVFKEENGKIYWKEEGDEKFELIEKMDE